jgi:hypothetical protein
MSLVEQEQSSPPVVSAVGVAQSLVFCAVFWDRCWSFFFWSLCCLSFFEIQILFTPLVSSTLLIAVVSFIGTGNRNTRRNTLTTYVLGNYSIFLALVFVALCEVQFHPLSGGLRLAWVCRGFLSCCLFIVFSFVLTCLCYIFSWCCTISVHYSVFDKTLYDQVCQCVSTGIPVSCSNKTDHRYKKSLKIPKGHTSSRYIIHHQLQKDVVTRLTRWVSLVEQELLTLSEHLSSPPVFSGVRVTRSS